MRELMREGIAPTSRSTDSALKYLLKVMQERGPFDAIIGYSEGATVAATLLLHEQRRFRKKGIKPMFKFAAFFNGWPPMDPNTHAMILSDESDATIEIPTCHISEHQRLHIPKPQVDVLLMILQLAPSTLMSMAPWLSSTSATRILLTCSITPRATLYLGTKTQSRNWGMLSGKQSRHMASINMSLRSRCGCVMVDSWPKVDTMPWLAYNF